MDHSLCPPIRTRTKPRHNTRNNPCSSSFCSATRFSNQLERHSSNQRQGGWRTATPIANHPPHTGNQSIGSSTPRPSEPSDTTTRPHQLGPSLPQVMTYLTTTRSSRSSCTSRHRRRTNPSSCRTTWFPGVLQRCRSEDSKRWPWLSPPPMVFGVWVWVAHPPPLVVAGGWGASDSVRPRRGRVFPSQAVKSPAAVTNRPCGH